VPVATAAVEAKAPEIKVRREVVIELL